jgi:hypothetical protein
MRRLMSGIRRNGARARCGHADGVFRLSTFKIPKPGQGISSKIFTRCRERIMGTRTQSEVLSAMTITECGADRRYSIAATKPD